MTMGKLFPQVPFAADETHLSWTCRMAASISEAASRPS